MALAFAIYQILLWNSNFIENEPGCRATFQSRLVLLGTYAYAREITLDDDRVDSSVVSFCKSHKRLGPLGVGDPHFGAVDYVVVTIFRNSGGHAERIGSA